jgi:hypothetical protein
MPDYGEHRADPYAPGQPQLGPVWGNVTRFTGANHQPLAAFPGKTTTNNNYLDDADYFADFEEVRDRGSVQRRNRTAAQERIGIYRGYDGANNLGVPPRLYNQVARVIVQQHSPALNVARAAEVFASINVAMADAGIDAWHWKYVYKLWRPVVGIRSRSAPDGDPFWAPLGAPQTNAGRGTFTPPFPAYPSGHATFGAAVIQALRLGLNTASGPMTVQDVLNVEDGMSAPNPKRRSPSSLMSSTESLSIPTDPCGRGRRSRSRTSWSPCGRTRSAASISVCTGGLTVFLAIPQTTSAECHSASRSARRHTSCSISLHHSAGPFSCVNEVPAPQWRGHLVHGQSRRWIRRNLCSQAAIADQHGIVEGCDATPQLYDRPLDAAQSGNGGDTPKTQWRVHGGRETHEAICSANTAKYHRRDSAL